LVDAWVTDCGSRSTGCGIRVTRCGISDWFCHLSDWLWYPSDWLWYRIATMYVFRSKWSYRISQTSFVLSMLQIIFLFVCKTAHDSHVFCRFNTTWGIFVENLTYIICN
jgi:hypothetical protein